MSGILNLLLAGAASVVKDAYFNLVTLLLNTTATNGAQNNTFLDSSTNNFTITRNGNTTQGTFTPFSQTGWSNYFDGSSYLSCGSSAFVFPSNFTVECWFYALTLPSNKAIFSSGNSVASGLDFGVNSSGQLYVYSNTFLGTSTGALTANTWNHVALVRNGSGSNNCVFYINGVSVGSFTSTTSFTATLNNIAGNSYDSTARPNAYISNFRSVIGTALYTSNFTPPTTPLTAISGTSLLICQSNRFVDNSANNFSITVTAGTPSVQAFSPFAPTTAYDTAVVGGSYYGDGSGDGIYFQDTTQSGTSSSFNLGASNNASVDHWWYPTAAQATAGFSKQVAAPTDWNGQIWYQVNLYDSGNISFFYRSGANFAYINAALPSNFLNQWNHVAIASDTSNNLSIFFNGVRVATTTATIGLASTTPNYITFGQQAASQTASSLKGYMSGLRFIQGSGAYNAAATTITIPTAPPTATATTQLLLNCTNAGIYDSAAKNDLETVGNAQVSTTQAKWGTTSMYFDGTGDRLQVGQTTTPNLILGTGDFTIELWVYFNSLPAGDLLLVGGDTNAAYLIANNSGQIRFGTYNVNWLIGPGGSMTTNNWYHVAVTRSGTTINLFLNGSAVVSSVSSAQNFSAASYVIGGDQVGGVTSLNGYMDDLRITKGYARYTANFTPPAAAFPIQ